MATEIAPPQADQYEGLSRDDLLRAYRNMVTSRRIDDKEIQLKRQNRIFFQISGRRARGRPDGDRVPDAEGLGLALPVLPRPRALPRPRREPPGHVPAGGRRRRRPRVRGAADALALGRRRAPHLHDLLARRRPNACRASARPRPAGISQREQRPARPASSAPSHGAAADEIVVVTIGEGSTSEGEFWEALNAACLSKLPVVFVVEDNGYAISVPVEVNTPGGSISKLVRRIPASSSPRRTAATSSPRTTRCVTRSRTRARGKGPSLVHAHVVRPYSHSLSDDEKLYRSEAERKKDSARDPLALFAAFLTKENLASAEELAALREEVDAAVNAAADEAARPARSPAPTPCSAPHLSREVDPTSRPPSTRRTRPAFTGEPTTMVDLINAALRDEMARDERIAIWGEDVADASRDRRARRVQGKGRRLQGDGRPPEGVRARARLQLASRRGGHRRARPRMGSARTQARRRDPVLRLHLARHAADPGRARDDTLALGRVLQDARRHPGRDRRLSHGRRAVPLAVGRGDLRAHPRAPCRDAVQRPRRERPPPHGDPLRRSRALPRAQALVPADPQQGPLPRPGFHDSLRQGEEPCGPGPTRRS